MGPVHRRVHHVRVRLLRLHQGHRAGQGAAAHQARLHRETARGFGQGEVRRPGGLALRRGAEAVQEPRRRGHEWSGTEVHRTRRGGRRGLFSQTKAVLRGPRAKRAQEAESRQGKELAEPRLEIQNFGAATVKSSTVGKRKEPEKGTGGKNGKAGGRRARASPSASEASVLRGGCFAVSTAAASERACGDRNRGTSTVATK